MSTEAGGAAGARSAPHDVAGRRLGAWRVEALVGRGGFGAVYRAVRADGVGRPVAVKVLGGWADDAAARRLFESERHILARLEHEHIARLLDAGTTDDGAPYLVMDFVDGRPVTEHARGLPLEERLRLFEQVCAAVHYAHQNLVVHRDIKPANVLVTADGVPRLLDFGIARLVERGRAEGEDPTLTLVRPLTPEYASPEQVRGAPVTTASDVYSLGALLYELLAGVPAHVLKSRAPGEIVRVVCDEDPPPPSVAVKRAAPQPVAAEAETRTLPGAASAPCPRPDAGLVSAPAAPPVAVPARRLAGDLDTIVMKALHKDPRRRYGSADELGADVRRHLEGRPVQARADSVWYRAGKFTRRHRAAVAVSALLAFSLVTGGLAAAWQWRVARRESALAQRRFEDVHVLAHAALFDLHDAIADLPGATPVRALLVARALDYLDGLSRDARGERALQRELATAYVRVGDVQGRPNSPNLGDTAGALASYAKAVAIGEELAAADPADEQARVDMAAALNRRALLLDHARGDVQGALRHAERALALQEPLAAAAPDDAARQRHVLATLSTLADLQIRSGALDAALANYERLLVMAQRLAARPDATREDRRTLMVTHYRIYRGLALAGRRREALDAAWRMLGMARERRRQDPYGATPRRDLAVVLNVVGDSLVALDRPAEALRHYHEAFDLRRGALADASDALARRDLVGSYVKIGDALASLGDAAGALRQFAEAAAIMDAVARRDPADVGARADLAGVLVRIAQQHLRAGQPRRALAASARGAAVFEKLLAESRGNADARYDAAYAVTWLARTHAALAAGSPQERRTACATFARAGELWRGLDDADGTPRFNAGPASRYAAEAERDLARCSSAPPQ